MTTKTQHTPGPWKICGPNIRSDHHTDGPGALVLVAGTVFHDYTPDPDEERANLALAAAAPDLLRVIEKVGRIVGHVQDDLGLTADDVNTALSKACSALGGIYFATTGKPLEWWLHEPADEIPSACKAELDRDGGADNPPLTPAQTKFHHPLRDVEDQIRQLEEVPGWEWDSEDTDA
jgi:hypothetical protein